jgi:8-oxo-dGTP diphosphatase
MSSKPFRLSVKVIVVDDRGRCLLLKRSMASKGNPGKWDFPGGKVDPGENFTDALLREIAEETGLTVTLEHVIGTAESELPAFIVAYLFFQAHTKAGRVQISQEHDEYRWVERERLPQMDIATQFEGFVKTYSATRHTASGAAQRSP